MSIRKMLPMMMVAVALLAASTAFAADAPPVPMSQDEFLSTLQAPSGEARAELPALEGMQTPVLQHGTNSSYLGVKCRKCTGGYYACDAETCLYNGSWHTHYYNCGGCTNPCSI